MSTVGLFLVIGFPVAVAAAAIAAELRGLLSSPPSKGAQS